MINHYYSFYSKYVFKNVNEVESTSFLFNTKITVGNKIISNKSLIDKDIFYIYQLKTNGQFLNFQEFNTKFNLRLNFLQYTSIINSIKTYLKKCSNLKSQNEIKCQSPVNKILMNKRGASSIYKELIISNQDITGLERWKKISHITTNNYYNAFKILKFTTQDMKLRWLQFRILHHILTTNRSVAKFNKNQDHRCTFCGAHSETIIHLMWECANVQNFWNDLSLLINRKCLHSHKFSFTKDLVIFGISNTIKTYKICDLIVLLAKLYIYIELKCSTTH